VTCAHLELSARHIVTNVLCQAHRAGSGWRSRQRCTARQMAPSSGGRPPELASILYSLQPACCGITSLAVRVVYKCAAWSRMGRSCRCVHMRKARHTGQQQDPQTVGKPPLAHATSQQAGTHVDRAPAGQFGFCTFEVGLAHVQRSNSNIRMPSQGLACGRRGS
jgi:hypothetical protein